MRIARSQVHSWLLLVSAVGLCGCPLLLEDDFSIAAFSLPDAGDPCIGSTCHVPHSNIGGSSGEGGAAGASSGAAGMAGGGAAGAGGGGSSGSSGQSGAGGVSSGGAAGSGSSGTSGEPDAGSAGAGSGGAGGSEDPCRTLELTDGTHEAACLGISGTNVIQTDDTTTLTLGYQDGDPCLSGTISGGPWGATFELGLAPGTNAWNADAAGVSGFEFTFRGSPQPPTVKVIYKMNGSSTDFCRFVDPGVNEVPFSSAHPDCSTSSSTVVNTTQLDELILAILPQNDTPYPVNFCVQIRALD